MLPTGFAPIPVKLPKILGEDLAGVVVEAPEGSKFKEGDRVFAGTDQFFKSGDQGGTDGEFVAADEHTVCLIPEGVSFLEAAAVPVAGLTAWQALERVFPLEGKRVLIHGGAGGVGGFAIQIAKAHGAHVTTTCSSAKVDYVSKKLGADVVIDYTKGPWEAAARESLGGERYDFVLDTIGGSYEAASLRLVKRGGQLAGVGATGPDVARVSLLGMAALLFNAGWRTLMGRLGLAPKYHFVMTESKASRGLEQIAELMREGKFKVHLDRVFPLEELAQAHEYLEQGRARGKVGILIKAMD
ncbi:hypothetical protein CHLNCDRAFT_136860 [Chlorella variabilis]|uniref:Enoyl reductase (ER) domain-containing protein n=1 Tax=Chlorella variabilis TaxID=554065 RepID=E1ZL75_CHLVA|nr:hypothetical protein CHLNCDRAFT_136860 [Chlorella variabilis]EFN53611.1 hypothetical protein CHLNCDRAFT_136860 [Chlorella variabilis]|eukprot:XP_005845713.1 hypothetical protein CHLNCDRAFT_136860 [Chlorella variabilis]